MGRLLNDTLTNTVTVCALALIFPSVLILRWRHWSTTTLVVIASLLLNGLLLVDGGLDAVAYRGVGSRTTLAAAFYAGSEAIVSASGMCFGQKSRAKWTTIVCALLLGVVGGVAGALPLFYHAAGGGATGGWSAPGGNAEIEPSPVCDDSDVCAVRFAVAVAALWFSFLVQGASDAATFTQHGSCKTWVVVVGRLVGLAGFGIILVGAFTASAGVDRGRINLLTTVVGPYLGYGVTNIVTQATGEMEDRDEGGEVRV